MTACESYGTHSTVVTGETRREEIREEGGEECIRERRGRERGRVIEEIYDEIVNSSSDNDDYI